MDTWYCARSKGKENFKHCSLSPLSILRPDLRPMLPSSSFQAPFFLCPHFECNFCAPSAPKSLNCNSLKQCQQGNKIRTPAMKRFIGTGSHPLSTVPTIHAHDEQRMSHLPSSVYHLFSLCPLPTSLPACFIGGAHQSTKYRHCTNENFSSHPPTVTRGVKRIHKNTEIEVKDIPIPNKPNSCQKEQTRSGVG
jgi:hypothetical protein